MKKHLKKILKIILWLIGSIIGLILVLILALQIPYVQNLVKDKAVTFLENKIHTEVSIGSIEIGLPKKIILTDFYLEDQSGDTLIAGKKIDIDVSLLKLFSNSLEINHIYLDGITAKINKNKDSIFNFDYIIKAFASEDTSTSSKPMQIDLDKIKIKNTKFYYDDVISKNDLSVNINEFETEFNAFDIEKMSFDIPKIKLEGLKLNLNQGLVEAVNKANDKIKEETNNQPLILTLNTIDFSKIDITYKDEKSKLDTKIAFEKLEAKVNTFDLNQQKVVLENLVIEDTYGALNIGQIEKKNTEKKGTENNTSWDFTVNKVRFTNVNFIYNDNNSKEIKKGLDPNHIAFNDLKMNAEKLIYSSSVISGKVNNFGFSEKNGFVLNNLSTEFEYASQKASLKNLEIITPQTVFKNESITLNYPSRASLSDHPENIQVKVDFENSTLAFKDIVYIVPSLANTTPFKGNENKVVNFTAKLNGTLDNLEIIRLKASGIGATKMDINGTVTGLPNIENTFFNLAINNFESTSEDISSILPKGTLPNSISLPDTFAIQGDFKGYLRDFKSKVDLKSSYGNAIVDATFDQNKINNEKYTVIASLDNFDIGKLLQNKDIGTVSMETTIQGTSLSPKIADATAKMKIISAKYNQYNYNNIIVNGDIKKGTFHVISKATDPHLTFDLESSGDFDNKYPKAKLTLNIELIDLNKLNLHAGPLKMKGLLNANFDSLDIDHLNGTLNATNFLVALESEQFPLDTISLRAVSTLENDSIILKSQFANATINGKYQLSTLSTSLKNSISKYININSNSKNNLPEEKQQLAFDIYIKEEEILKKIVPDLKEMEGITIKGNYNSANDSITINASIPNLNYAGSAITAGKFSLNNKNKALIYDLSVGKIKNTEFELPKTKISGAIENNTIAYQLQIVDPKEVEKYALSGNYILDNELSKISINPENLVLNYEKWNIDSENSISIHPNGIHIKDFFLSNDKDALKIQSENENFNAPIAIDLKNFELQSITNIVNSDYEFGGTINGTTTIENSNTTPLFIADIAIENFSIKKDTVGNIDLKIDNKIANTYTANITITGNENNVGIKGTYTTGESLLNFSVALNKLQMQSIQAFTSGNLKESEGYLNGKLQITGKATNPDVVGDIKFNQVGFNVVSLNSKYKLINDTINFKDNLITFKKFRFKDENDNDLEINGTINSADYSNVGFDLNVVADNFRAVNSKAKDNDLFYGELYLDNNINIKGDFESPIVEGNIKINKDTEFTIVLPQEDPSIADREGIVTFVDQDQPVLITVKDPTKNITETEIKGITASVNIEIDQEAAISIIIDKANGDFLKLKGEAKLNGGIDPSGKTTLTGKYEFTDGSYEMNFNLIKRKFDIKPGSYILWTGEPTMANMNVTAIYKSDIAPIDLVNDQLVTSSAEDRNKFKQKIPFETELKMTGELMQPEINFDIVLPEGNNTVSSEVINTTQAKLAQIRQQEDVLNKQVFAILLLNRFIGENPFQSESGGVSASYLAKQSASRILSEQLNQIAGDLIQGFELNFDLEASEDYTSGQKQDKTDLNVGISKELLDDRLKISVGSSFGIEGGQNENEQANTIAGDVAAEYLITKDGRYKLKAYRKNNYQVALQGQVIETGVAFIITMNYNKFKELFQKNKEVK